MGEVKRKGRSPGRGTHALPGHVLRTGHFATKCVRVPSLKGLKVDVCGIRACIKTIISKNAKNIILAASEAGFKPGQSEGFGEVTGHICLASRNFK